MHLLQTIDSQLYMLCWLNYLKIITAFQETVFIYLKIMTYLTFIKLSVLIVIYVEVYDLICPYLFYVLFKVIQGQDRN